MATKKASKLECAVAHALDVLGDYWTMMIIRDLMIFGGTRRFDSLCEALDISRNILTERLRVLVEKEIVRKVPITEGARRMEYRLTRKGWELMPILLSIGQWCARWSEGEDVEAYGYVDRENGDFVFVPGESRNAGNEYFPNPATRMITHHMPAAIPEIEVPDHRYPLRRRGPDDE